MPKTKTVPLEDLQTALAVSEVSSVTTDERSVLEALLAEFKRIDERVEEAIKAINQAMRTQAVVAKGVALLNVERSSEGFTEENRNQRLLPLLMELGGPSEKEMKTWMGSLLPIAISGVLKINPPYCVAANLAHLYSRQ